jgi:hypothetical protein
MEATDRSRRHRHRQGEMQRRALYRRACWVELASPWRCLPRWKGDGGTVGRGEGCGWLRGWQMAHRTNWHPPPPVGHGDDLRLGSARRECPQRATCASNVDGGDEKRRFPCSHVKKEAVVDTRAREVDLRLQRRRVDDAVRVDACRTAHSACRRFDTARVDSRQTAPAVRRCLDTRRPMRLREMVANAYVRASVVGNLRVRRHGGCSGAPDLVRSAAT